MLLPGVSPWAVSVGGESHGPGSVLGLTGLWIAILADTGATVLVTLNALRLLRFNPEREA